jgi:hypothetical protein
MFGKVLGLLARSQAAHSAYIDRIRKRGSARFDPKVFRYLATSNRVHVGVFVFRPVEESPFRWDSPEQDQNDTQKDHFPMSLQERVQVSI